MKFKIVNYVLVDLTRLVGVHFVHLILNSVIQIIKSIIYVTLGIKIKNI